MIIAWSFLNNDIGFEKYFLYGLDLQYEYDVTSVTTKIKWMVFTMNEIPVKNVDSLTAIETARILGEYKNSTEDTTFIFPQSCTYDPFGMLVTSTSIRQYVTDNPDVKRFCRVYDGESSRYAGNMGFFKSISEKLQIGKDPGEARGGSTYIPITRIDLSELRTRALREKIVVQQQIQNTALKLGTVLSRGNENLKRSLTYIIREIMRNTEEHSKSDLLWICAQYWPYYNLVEVAILDEGIGVRRSLLSNKAFRSVISDDKSALSLCLLPGITEAYKRYDQDSDVWANSGFGLYITQAICSYLGGIFLIASGDNCIGISVNPDTLESNRICKSTHIKGTALCIRLSTQKIRYNKLRKFKKG